MAKKNTKKETLETQIEKQIEIMENSNDKIESTEIQATISDIATSINNVNVDIESDSVENIKEMAKEFNKALAPFDELSAEINEQTNNMATFDDKVSKTDSIEGLETLINKEIETTKELITKVEKINNNKTQTKLTSFTNWWNGMGYDF